MDDYLSEKEQWEWLKGWLRVNVPWIIGGVAAGAVLLFAWRWWDGRTDRLALAGSTRYQEIIATFVHGEPAKAFALIDSLARDLPASPYLDQANLAAARVLVDSGQLDKANERLKGVMEHTKDHALSLVARGRLARVQIAQNAPDAALATLAVEAGSFAPLYHETRGDAFEAKHDRAAALKEYHLARSSDVGGLEDAETLDLKIGDLLADERAPAAAPGAK